MNNNLSRHKLLKILADKYLKVNQGQEQALGVSWEDLMAKMNCSLGELMDISSTLFDEQEVDKHDAYGIKGIYAKMKGVSSYSTRKYRKENEKLIFERFKNWIQVLIPIISLLVTLYVVIASERRIEDKDNQINKYDNRLLELERKMDTLDNKTSIATLDTVKLKKPK
jgi:hypothetical protein